MDDSITVRLCERQSDLIENVRNQRQRNLRIALLETGKCLSVEILHYQVRHVAAGGFGDAEIRYVDDVRMAEAAAGLRFALEPREKLRFFRPLRSDHFHRNDARGSEVSRQVDIAHPARAELFVDAVLGVEDFADHWKSPAAIITIASLEAWTAAWMFR